MLFPATVKFAAGIDFGRGSLRDLRCRGFPRIEGDVVG